VETVRPAILFQTALYLGIRDSEVKQLQEALNTQISTRLADSGAGSPGQETEYYGPVTEDAVKRFQCEQGIVCSGTAITTGYGVVGPRTQARLNEIFGRVATAPSTTGSTVPPASSIGRFSSNLYPGLRGTEVTALQNYLASDRDLYPEGLVTGFYGTLTQRAVERFQCRHSIVCGGTLTTTGYGRVGPRTLAQLNTIVGGSVVQPSTAPTATPVTPPPATTIPPPPSAISESERRAQERAEADAGEAAVIPSASVSEPSGSLFDRTLVLGSTGEDVRVLQRMLAQDPAVYPEGYVTGLFSNTTEQAVRRFQTKHGVVSSGTPGTTGYGAVGPATQEKLIEVFGRP
jgi:peptidoglycan hydrolase-like protein with peptidoglycan-binding domain